MSQNSSRGLAAKVSIGLGITAITLVGALSGCTTSNSSVDREASANPDMPTVCYTNIGQGPIEIEWNAGHGDSKIHNLNVTERWCDDTNYAAYQLVSRAGIRWSMDSHGQRDQVLVESGTGFQGLFSRYLDTSPAIDQWVDMPLYGDGGGGMTDIGPHRIITNSWKEGTSKKFIGVWVQD